MTLLFEGEVICCVCGTESNPTVIGSTNTSGSPDLDTRPPEMERSTIDHWIQHCPSCNYCASDLSDCDENVKEIIESKEYQAIFEDMSLPEVAISFMASAYLNQKLVLYSDSAWDAVYAAWVCDDENDYESARECRIVAIKMIEKAKDESQTFAEQPGLMEAITIDLMRRSEKFHEAIELANKTREMDFEDIIKQMVNYQERLILQKDKSSHTIIEAEEHGLNDNCNMQRKVNILILDDEETILYSYPLILKEFLPAPLSIRTTVDGDKALRILRESDTSFDLLITDSRHPGKSCFELIEIIREDFPTTKVLLTSASGIIANSDKRFLADAFLQKPINIKPDFVGVLERLLEI